MVKVRFAPSPTGDLHIGGARTALFNWLFARKKGGTFVLRIEDTDKERSCDCYTQNIIESLNWLGLIPDEGPYFQSDRMKVYRKYADQLLLEGKAYRCFCNAHSDNGALCSCYKLNVEEVEELMTNGVPYAVKLRIVNRSVDFCDFLRGNIHFDLEDLNDLVIIKSDGFPAYNFAVVVDDAEMGITHVIRGDDHISNTPKQFLIYDALGFPPPVFAHIPMILGKDGKRLSKRQGAVSVLEYRNQGFLPEAVVNFLALLGWSAGNSKQIFTKEELIESFDLERVKKSAAVFDVEKLVWVNAEHIKLVDIDTLTRKGAEYIRLKGYVFSDIDLGYLKRVIEIIGARIKTLEDIWRYGDFFFREEIQMGDLDFSPDRNMVEFIQALINLIVDLQEFNALQLESTIRAGCKNHGVSLKAAAKHIRYALTGKTVSPGLFETMEVLGRQRVVHRLKKYLQLTVQRDNN